MTDTQLYNKLSSLPANLKLEAIDFIDFLIYKSTKKEKVDKNSIVSKSKILADIKQGLEEVKLIENGKKKGTSLNDFLNEI